MSEPVDVPRPAPAAERSVFFDRMHDLRRDSRVAAIVLGCVAVASGVAWFRSGIAPTAPAGGRASTTSTSAPFAAGTGAGGASVPAAPSTTVGQLVVDVVGAVRAPGVVSLPATARVLDAIRAAGGAAAGADLARLNLAAKVGDGARVAVPLIGRPPPVVDPSAVTGSPDPAAGGATGADAGVASATAPVNLNSASAAELETLPGIGPSLAAAMVQERERNGPFRSVDELNRVPGIGPGRLARLRGLVAV